MTVNAITLYRKGEYFRKGISVANSSAPVWQSVTVAATSETTVTGNIFVPKTQEQFTYDLDGNLTGDGRWTYTWDGENRLVRLVANTSVGSQLRLDFAYDSKGRRISKRVWNNTAGTGNPTNDLKFVYDGWNLISELNATNSSIIRSYMWSLDLSGTPQEAGGVGGLLALNDVASGVHFAAYDGNGNVAALVKAIDGTVSALYEYGPFGEVLRTTGPVARTNPFRFSTKYQDDETDFLYYGFRYYSSSSGRWSSRDPAEEEGGPTLSGFVNNNPINEWDYLGLCGPLAQCGPDVTRPVLATIGNIRTTFGSWSYGQKFNACTALYGIYGRGAWGMDKITQLGFPSTITGNGLWLFNPPAVQGGPPQCDKTVAYKNTCYLSSDVNYLMWGAINKMCWRSVGFRISTVWSLTWAQYAAIAWKGGHHDPWRRWVGAVAFTRAGWQEGNLDLTSGERWFVKQSSCSISPSNRAAEPSFRWQWWPNSVIWPLKPWPL